LLTGKSEAFAMNIKRVLFSVLFGVLNFAAAYLLFDPIMSIVDRQFQEGDLYQIIAVLTVTLILDIGTFQEIAK
jgi:hypothetical protein